MQSSGRFIALLRPCGKRRGDDFRDTESPSVVDLTAIDEVLAGRIRRWIGRRYSARSWTAASELTMALWLACWPRWLVRACLKRRRGKDQRQLPALANHLDGRSVCWAVDHPQVASTYHDRRRLQH